MALELKSADAVDLVDEAAWRPKGPEEVWFPLTAFIGETGQEAGTFFEVMVATPESLRGLRHRGGRPRGTKVLLVEGEYSWEGLLDQIRRIIASCDTGFWSLSIDKLREHFHWEYEDQSRSR